MSIKMALAGFIFFLCTYVQGQNKVNNKDFDFYYGNWEVFNKKQMDDGTWSVFTANVEARETLNGYGNVDFFNAIIDGKPYLGMTIRFYNEENDTWRIIWYDTDQMHEDPNPSIGKFENGEGKFYKTINTSSGREVTVQFYWSQIKKDSFHWEARWSIDGVNWNPTWIMDFKRITK